MNTAYPDMNTKCYMGRGTDLKLLPYIGVCHTIRKSKKGEDFYKEVARSISEQVSLSEFEKKVDLVEILDEGETFAQWLDLSETFAQWLSDNPEQTLQPLRLSVYEGNSIYWVQDITGFEFFWGIVDLN